MRCLYPLAPDFPSSKINKCVENVAQIYHDTTDKSGTQLIFCDMATPKAPQSEKTFGVYRKNEDGIYINICQEALKNRAFNAVVNDLIGGKGDKDILSDIDGKLQPNDIVVFNKPDTKNEILENIAYVIDSDLKLKDALSADYEEIGVKEKESFTPNQEERFNAYEDIKKKLVSRGVKESEIAFIHDCKNDDEKKALYDRVNNGEIRVLLGSSEKCGAGMNAQKKMVALHHLDPTMKPSDMAQRNGRICRQGNENKEVDIYEYMTERTFDAYLFQMLENKQKFISQIMTEIPPCRQMDDIDQATLSYSTCKSLCIGNPLIKEHIELQNAITDLQIKRKMYQESKLKLQSELIDIPAKINRYESSIKNNEKDQETVKQAKTVTITNEKGIAKQVYPITVCGKEFTDNEQAGKAIRAFIKDHVADVLDHPIPFGEYKGLTLMTVPTSSGMAESYNINLCLKGELPHYSTSLTPPNPYKMFEGEDIFKDSHSAVGFITRIENAIASIPKSIENSRNELETLNTSKTNVEKQLEKPFEYQKELDDKQFRLAEVEVALEGSDVTSSYKFTLFTSITDLCPELIKNDDFCMHYLDNSDSFMPLTIERHGDVVYMSHTSEQNGDLMSDPLVVMKIDTSTQSMEPLSITHDYLGYYQETKDTEAQQEVADFMENWFDNIENQGFVSVTEQQYSDRMEKRREARSAVQEDIHIQEQEQPQTGTDR